MQRHLAVLLLFGLLFGGLSICGGTAEDGDAGQEPAPDDLSSNTDVIDPLSTNATCYVCHIPFVREDISRVHFAEKITCVKCHGLSAAHANDEDIGATKPDVTFSRDQVDQMCTKCHKGHDVPANKVLARFVERKLGDTTAVCTDCHGHHRIEESADPADRDE